MKKQILRLKLIYDILKIKELSLNEILHYLKLQDALVSKRQLIRDITDLHYLLSEDEQLNSHFKGKEKYLFIFESNFNYNNSSLIGDKIVETQFYDQIKTFTINTQYNLIEQCIQRHSKLKIEVLKYDDTGDNYDYSTKPFTILPVALILHRGSYYLGGWNINKKCAQFLGVNQLKHISNLNTTFSFSRYETLVKKELDARFGITKNINQEVYRIKLEFSSATGAFVSNHYWHATQVFKSSNGNIIMTMFCGINRELISWLCQWLYNVKIIEPPILIAYHNKVLKEMQETCSASTPLVYKNLLTPASTL